jgi:hypothetical protein
MRDVPWMFAASRLCVFQKELGDAGSKHDYVGPLIVPSRGLRNADWTICLLDDSHLWPLRAALPSPPIRMDRPSAGFIQTAKPPCCCCLVLRSSRHTESIKYVTASSWSICGNLGSMYWDLRTRRTISLVSNTAMMSDSRSTHLNGPV